MYQNFVFLCNLTLLTLDFVNAIAIRVVISGIYNWLGLSVYTGLRPVSHSNLYFKMLIC